MPDSSLLFKLRTGVIWPLGYRIRKLLFPESIKVAEGPYKFEVARKYWGNAPRLAGDNPLNTADLDQVTDETLLQEFDGELELARQKKERQVGFDLASKIIAKNPAPRVMDYGSGIGFYGFEMLIRHPDAQVTFVDINEDNLKIIERIASAKGLRSRVSWALVRDEKAADVHFPEPFDLIISMSVLHHTPYAGDIVKNLFRFLKPGGIFQVMLYNRFYLEQMQTVTGKELDESEFGSMTDPRVRGLINPYSEAYDIQKAKDIFTDYEFLGVQHPDPFYDIYHFRKPCDE